MTLADMPKGQYAQVHSLSAPWHSKRRLMELGFTPGSTLRLRGRAPLNGPLLVECRGTTIALRPHDAQSITVTLQEN